MWKTGGTHTLTDATRKRILNRDQHQCTATMRDTGRRCPATSNLEVDHITPYSQGGTDQDNNLRTLCHWHHLKKTEAEAAQGRQAKRPKPKHPAML